VESYSYNVFGSPTISDGDGVEISASAIGNPYMFTGRRYDEDTGLYYYRLRDFHPVLGRFVQNDPIGYAGGLNLYTYCGNNSLSYLDPYGLDRYLVKQHGTHYLIGIEVEGRMQYFDFVPHYSSLGVGGIFRTYGMVRRYRNVPFIRSIHRIPSHPSADMMLLAHLMAERQECHHFYSLIFYNCRDYAEDHIDFGMDYFPLREDQDDSAADQIQVDAITGASIKAPTKGGKELNNVGSSSIASTESTSCLIPLEFFPEPLRSIITEQRNRIRGPLVSGTWHEYH